MLVVCRGAKNLASLEPILTYDTQLVAYALLIMLLLIVELH
jgi:hypothetical protein